MTIRSLSIVVAALAPLVAVPAAYAYFCNDPADPTAASLFSTPWAIRYAEAISKGLPIATGVIEGACRYLVRDRMDKTGAHWRVAGAEAVLQLRALRANGDFNAYWEHHIKAEYQRNHASRYAANDVPNPATTAFARFASSSRWS